MIHTIDGVLRLLLAIHRYGSNVAMYESTRFNLVNLE